MSSASVASSASTSSSTIDDVLDVVIVGGGPAAYSAALYTARYALKHILFEGTEAGGQLLKTTHIENYPGVGKCNGYELVMGMRPETKAANLDHEGVVRGELKGEAKESANFVTGFRNDALDQGATIISEMVTKLELGSLPFKVHTGDGRRFQTRSVIFATGATPRQIPMPSNDNPAKPFFNLLTCAVCDGRHPHFKRRATAVVGGGDSAMEDAIFLAKTSKPVYIIQRNDRFRASAVMLKRACETEGIVFLTHTVVADAFYDDKYEASDMKKKPSYRYMNALRLTRTDGGIHTHHDIKDGILPIAGLFFAIGHEPATKLVKSQLELNEDGYIKIIPGTDTATSIPGVHASGDCQDFKYRQAVRAISSGCEAAMNVNHWLLHQH